MPYPIRITLTPGERYLFRHQIRYSAHLGDCRLDGKDLIFDDYEGLAATRCRFGTDVHPAEGTMFADWSAVIDKLDRAAAVAA